MKDKELLKLAAKAVKMPLNCQDGWNWVDNVGVEKAWGLWNGVINPTISNPNPRPNPIRWNPLQSDSDALKLVMKLGFIVKVLNERMEPFTLVRCGENGLIFEEEHRGDAGKATRRAIVRAAASIGKIML